MKNRLRWISALVLCTFFSSLCAPIVHAQFVYGDTTSNSGYDDFVAKARQTMSDTELWEQKYSEQAQRQAQAQSAISELQAMQCPPGYSQSEWNALVQRRTAELGSYNQENQSLLDRTKTRLQGYYNDLESFKNQVRGSTDPQLQEVGAMLGAAGAQTVPIWSRPTARQIGATAGTVVDRGRVATINARVGSAEAPGPYSRWSTNLGEAATGHAATIANANSVRVQWTPTVQGEGASAVYVLKPNVTGGTYNAEPIVTNVKVNQQAANGNWIENPGAKEWANNLSSQQTSRSNIELQITKLKAQAAKTTDTAVKGQLDKHIKNLEGKRSQLNGEIEAYNSQNPSLKQQAKALGVSAAKWAATSMAITYGADVVSQLANNGWDPRQVNWAQGLEPFKTKEFWGGTAGSFVGSMAGTAIASALPGGVLVKTLFAVGGAALGWQVGSGNLAKTDWTQLAATTIGATLGSVLGGLLGPWGAVIGGIAGSYAADWLLKKFRDWGGMPMITNSRPGEVTRPGTIPDQQQYATGNQQTASGYTGYSPVDTGYQSQYSQSGSSAAQLGEQRKQLMVQFNACISQNPPDMNQARQIREQLTQIDSALNGQRQGQY